MRIVLDTSVMVAALRSRSGASRAWLESVFRGEHTAVISVALVLEYEDVLTRQRNLTACGLDAAEVRQLLDGLCSVADQVETSPLWRPFLRDPDDEMVLEAAVQGGAELLLTFNVRDFAGCDQLGVQVSTPGEAWRTTKS